MQPEILGSAPNLAEELDVDDTQLHARVPATARLPAELRTLIDACMQLEPGRAPLADEILPRLYALT